MNKVICVLAVASGCLAPVAAQAGGWGSNGNASQSSGLVNVSPSIGLGNVNVLNGVSVLNGSGVLSGNAVGILNGNKTGIANGVLGSVLSGNNVYKLKK